jgi:hypothetical protein
MIQDDNALERGHLNPKQRIEHSNRLSEMGNNGLMFRLINTIDSDSIKNEISYETREILKLSINPIVSAAWYEEKLANGGEKLTNREVDKKTAAIDRQDKEAELKSRTSEKEKWDAHSSRKGTSKSADMKPNNVKIETEENKKVKKDNIVISSFRRMIGR